MAESEQNAPKQQPAVTRAANFSVKYASHVHFNTSMFDLTMTFGQFLPTERGDQTYLEQHTSMSVSWLEAKLAALFLVTNIALHEAQFGVIRIPPNARPEFFPKELGDKSIQHSLPALCEQLIRDIAEATRSEQPAPPPQSPPVNKQDQ